MSSHAATSLSFLPAPAVPPRFRIGWIVNRPVDLCFFIGGALSGYLVFFLHAGLGWNIALLWFVWYITLDVPHFFGTYARTYLDREELRKRRRLLLGSLTWLLVGPAVVGVQYLMFCSESAAVRSLYYLPFLVLSVFVSLWAYWHVVRQHYGIMALYKRKSQDAAWIDQIVDKTMLYGGLLAPFAALAVTHPDAREGLRLLLHQPAEGGWLDKGAAVSQAAMAFVACAAVAFLSRQAYRWMHGMPINLAKVLFLAAVVPLHVLVCWHPATLAAGLLGFSMFVTIFHDVQYHAIIWHYQKNRYRRPGEGWRRYGPAAVVGRSFFIYFACALLMGLAGGYFACLFDFNIGCTPVVRSSEVFLYADVTLAQLLTGLMFGFLMLHYWVDQFIWRPSKDADLRRDLRMAGE